MSPSPTAVFGTSPTLSKRQTVSPQPQPTRFSPQLKVSGNREVRIVAGQSIDITGSFFEVAVGKEGHRESFFVHENLFTSHSQFFGRAAKAEWLDQKRVIMLPKDDPITFRLYAVLSYTGFLITKDLPYEWQSLVDIYVLSEKLQDSWAKNCIIDAMHSFATEKMPRLRASTGEIVQFGDHISAASLAELYAGTISGSQARKFVVDLFADNGSGEWLASAASLLPQEFLLEVTVRLLEKRGYIVFGNVLDRPSSDYHEKDNGKERPVRDRLEKVPPSMEVAPSVPSTKPADTDNKACSIHAASLKPQNASVPMGKAEPSPPPSV